ncbi:hypothetical protein ACTOB_004198 [Actinoplanes oblitus]|uniref:Uncharacterized protein n=1 Tax=Actinoplanes oblitus TaxID=3040509 RepID=A0ABY8WTL6_9ACTN|nr:hypothetical protein [Actinoplanes oblitus]WIN00489.1 hypothetical protein ACTOB_004198 [Actinoplanes oblitus]
MAGQETLSRLLAEGIAEAPAGASPLAAVALGLERASSTMGPLNRELGPRLKAAVAASTELQERDALKTARRARTTRVAVRSGRRLASRSGTGRQVVPEIAFESSHLGWPEGGARTACTAARPGRHRSVYFASGAVPVAYQASAW